MAQPVGGKPGGPSISGTVIDESDAVIPYASVALYLQSDSSLAGGAATNGDGVFRVEAKPGKYFLKISFLSFQDRVIPNINHGKEGTKLGRIRLKSGAETLGEVEIEAERPQMELKLDKRVFNVDKDMSNNGANAAEVLDNIPSVAVDVEGNVSLRGSENVRILIDGKPSGLVGLSSTDALRQLQGDMVEKVEVITNPSARYDAEGEVGIINIVLKKERREGVNGSFTGRAGWPANFGGSFNLNVRRKKVNFFTSYGLGYRNRPGGGTSYQRFSYGDTVYSYDRTDERDRMSLSHTFRGGIDFDLGERSSITLAGTGKVSDGNNLSALVYKDYDENEVATQVVNRSEDEIEEEDSKQFSLNYRKTFKQKERLLTIDADWNESSEYESADLYEYSSDANVIPISQRTDNLEKESRWLFQTDYIHPFGEEGKFEIGSKVILRTLDSDYGLYNQLSDASWEVDSQYDNHMIYYENIYAAYIMAGNKTGRFSYQLGLRGEYSDVETNLVQTNWTNARDYFNLFPTAHFSYEFKKENFVQLSYARRISRPRHWWLLPFFGFNDSRNFFSGNPDINPQFTNSYEVGYLKQWDNGSLLASLYHRHTDDFMDRILFSDSTGFTTTFPVNLGTEDSYGIEFSGSYEPVKWWSFNGSFNYYRSIEDGSYEGVDYDNDTYAYSMRVVSRWKVKRKFSCQTSFNFRSPRLSNQGRHRSTYNWDAGASLDVLKGNGTLTFSVKDILNSRRRRIIIEEEDYYSEMNFQWRARQSTLSFTYRLNQKKGRNKGGGDYGGGDFDGGM